MDQVIIYGSQYGTTKKYAEELSKGIGRALLTETMRIFNENEERTVYLHTQPWSYKAIKLYMDFGFCALKSETFSDFNNEFEESIQVLKKIC